VNNKIMLASPVVVLGTADVAREVTGDVTGSDVWNVVVNVVELNSTRTPLVTRSLSTYSSA